jgi:hypothetical protein
MLCRNTVPLVAQFAVGERQGAMRHLTIVGLGVLLATSPGVSLAQDSSVARTRRVAELRSALEGIFSLQVESLEVRSDSVVALVLGEGSSFWKLGPAQLQDSTRNVAWWLWGEAEQLGAVRVLTICCHPSSGSIPIGAIYRARPEAPK